MARKVKAAHHRGTYQVRAAAVRAWAYANPDTVCGRCGYTLNAGPYHRRYGEKWEAGHVIDGQIGGALRPEARGCNRRAAAERTNALKAARGKHTSASW